MAYTPLLTAALTGASLRQLSYWRSSRATHGALLRPEYHEGRRVFYSYADLVALRTFVYLREELSLLKIRSAVGNLRELGNLDHLSRYKLVADARSIVVIDDQGDATDLVKKPGQRVIHFEDEIFRSFETAQGRLIVPLEHPKPNLDVDPRIRGGIPVISGTRVPYRLVSSLLEDGVSPRDVALIYPAVTSAAARDALEFAEYVESFAA